MYCDEPLILYYTYDVSKSEIHRDLRFKATSHYPVTGQLSVDRNSR